MEHAAFSVRGRCIGETRRTAALLAGSAAFAVAAPCAAQAMPIGAEAAALAAPAPQATTAPAATTQPVATVADAQQDIIVTGVLSATRRGDAPIALSTVSSDTLERTAPVSAADALKNVPGVYVNSSVGETRNIVYARGLSVGTQSATSGYYFVALLEDGLPLLGIQGSGYQPDVFFRQDLTVARVEALRGGSATVTGPNAPGGLFNYISRNALTDHDGGRASLRVGVEGDDGPFQRADLYYGTKIGTSGLSASIGGFYRRSFGSRPADYPFNRGGEVKASIGWDYGRGTLMLYGKYLDDHNGSYDSERIPSTGFADPKIAPGLSRTDNFYLGEASAYTVPGVSPLASQRFDPSDLDHSRSRQIGLKWEHDLGWGIKLSNNFRFVSNDLKLNQTGIGTYGLDNPNLWNVVGFSASGLLNRAGVITLSGANGSTLARVATTTTGGYTVLSNALPNQQVLANGVLAGTGTSTALHDDSWIDQFSATKQFGRLTVTAGAYLSRSSFHRALLAPGGYIAGIENNPTAASVSFFDNATGNTYQITNSAGFGAIDAAPQSNYVRNRSTSAFGGATWRITDKLTLDGGLRFESFGFRGTNLIATANPNAKVRTYGGLDGNATTIYDNVYGLLTRVVPFDRSLQFVNWSGAVNYRFSRSLSAYVRYSHGYKNGDGLWGGYDTVFKAESQPITPPEITQYEAALNYHTQHLTLSVTPFFTLLDKVNVVSVGTDLDGTTYVTPPAFNKTRTYGVEIEGNVGPFAGLSAHAALTFQRGKALQWFVWNLGQTGKADDVLQSFPDSALENLPELQGRVGLEYTAGKFDGLVNFTYLGSRPNNYTGVTVFPAQHQTDLSLYYDLTDTFRIGFNVNNLFNDIGIFSLQNPNLAVSGLTQTQLQTLYPNATIGIATTQPRSYFLTGSVRF